MFVRKYMAVNKLLHLLQVCSGADKCIGSGVFFVAQYAKQEMVGSDAIASGSHSFFPGVINDGIELV